MVAADDGVNYGCRTNSEDVTLAEVYDNEEYRGEKVTIAYEYDCDLGRDGDNWIHDISFIGRADPSMRKNLGLSDKSPVVCISGEVCFLPGSLPSALEFAG